MTSLPEIQAMNLGAFSREAREAICFLLAALAAAEADRDRAKADAREAWSVEAQAADLLRDVRRDLARAEAERDALAKQLDEALSANHDGGYAIIGLQAERDALRMAGEAWRTALPADLVMAAASRLRQLQEAEEASSGSGGPGDNTQRLPKLFDLWVNRHHFPAGTVAERLAGFEIHGLLDPPIPADHDLWRVVPGHPDERLADTDVVDLTAGTCQIFSAPKHINAGSGGPGVHLTAEQAERIAFVLEGRSHSLNCGVWVSGEPCTCGRAAALALLRPVVRGGGQADTKEGA